MNFDRIIENIALKKLKEIGYTKDRLEFLEEGNFADGNGASNYWYYSGPNDEKTRDFCKELLRIDKFYREEDLNSLSRFVGYNVLEHQGGFNCRHTWQKVSAKMKQDTPTKGQVNKAAVKQDSRIQDYLPFILPFKN